MAERTGRLNFSAISAESAKVVAAIGTLPTKPERFGRYMLLDRICSGGMAEVFRAVMPGAQGFRQTLVVKRILAERSRATDFLDMFVQEARIGALLSHPTIVQVFDFGNVGGDYFLAMEYLRGRDVQVLMRKLREQNLLCPVPIAAFIAHEVATCLGYAHDLVAYVPSTRILREGGGQEVGVPWDYGLPAREWDDDIEPRIDAAVEQRVRRVQRDGRLDVLARSVFIPFAVDALDRIHRLTLAPPAQRGAQPRRRAANNR